MEQRVRTPERMDEPGLEVAAHEQALDGLARIQRVSGGVGRLWRNVRRVAATHDRLTLCDVACGGGDLAVGLAARARRHNMALDVAGCDLSPTAIARARQFAARCGRAEVRFFAHDILSGPLPERFDIVTTTLFLHHLDDEQAVACLTHLAASARRLVVVEDLVRSRLGYALAWFGCRLLSRSPIVRFDGPVSVRAAFRPREVQALAQRAGWREFDLRRHWPERFTLAHHIRHPQQEGV